MQQSNTNENEVNPRIAGKEGWKENCWDDIDFGYDRHVTGKEGEKCFSSFV